MTTLQLWLQTSGDLSLEKIVLSDTDDRVLVRGRTGGAMQLPFTFSWTSAVRGLVILSIRTLLNHQGVAIEPVISGGKGSLAASLDYAISKKPNWVMDLFGEDSRGQSLVGRYFRRSNPERKRGDTVTIALATFRFGAQSLAIFLDGQRVSDNEVLNSLMQALESEGGFKLVPSKTLDQEPKAGILEQVRTSKSLRIMPGPHGIESYLRELYSSDEPLFLTSYMFRVASSLLPPEILEYSGASKVTRERATILQRRLRENSLHVLEILPAANYWNLIKKERHDKFKQFPPSVRDEHIVTLLKHYLNLIDTCPAYQPVLVVSPPTESIVTTDVLHRNQCERFIARQTVLDDVFPYDWSLELEYQLLPLCPPRHPMHEKGLQSVGTKTDRGASREVLANVLDYFLKHGPILPADVATINRVNGEKPRKDLQDDDFSLREKAA